MMRCDCCGGERVPLEVVPFPHYWHPDQVAVLCKLCRSGFCDCAERNKRATLEAMRGDTAS